MKYVATIRAFDRLGRLGIDGQEEVDADGDESAYGKALEMARKKDNDKVTHLVLKIREEETGRIIFRYPGYLNI